MKNLIQINHNLLNEVFSLLENYKLQLIKDTIKNKKLFKVVISIVNDNFCSNPNNLEVKLIKNAVKDINVDINMPNLMCTFISQKKEYLLVVTNKAQGIDLYDYCNFKKIKLMYKSNYLIVCSRHIAHKGIDYIITSCIKDLILFSSKDNYEILLKIENPHPKNLSCNIFLDQSELFIISCNNDKEFTKIWTMNKKMIRCFKNEINQVISIDLWTNKQIQYYIILGHITVQILNLKTGEIYRTFENLSDESNFQCCVIEKKNTSYLFVSSSKLYIFSIEDNCVVKAVPLCYPRAVIIWNEKFVLSLDRLYLNIVELNGDEISYKKIVSFKSKNQFISATTILHPIHGECLLAITRGCELVLFGQKK